MTYAGGGGDGGGAGAGGRNGVEAEAYSTPVLTRQGSRYGREEGGRGIQVRTELSVRSSEAEKGGAGEGGFGVQRPPMGYVRSYA